MNEPADIKEQMPGGMDEMRLVEENWQRYRYGVTRGHRDYTARAARLEGFYLGGDIDGDGKLMNGGQWTNEDISVLEEQGRPAYEFNQIMPGINAAIGYQVANRVDIAFQPRGGDATKHMAEVRSKVAMQIADQNKLPWRETEVFADGLIQQRGYFECRMCWDDSILGELKIGVLDPMDVIPDPDSKSYEPTGWGDVIVTRWLTFDEVEGLYGQDARKRAEQGHAVTWDSEDFGDGDDDDTTPRSRFGPLYRGHYDSEYSGGDIRRLRVIDRQKKMMTLSRVVIYPSGDVRALNGDEADEVIASYKRQGAFPTRRMVTRIRWIVTTAGAVLHDDWSPYDRYTVIPFFPYFRRGKTRGMVDNAIGPQCVINKGMSQAIHIVNSTANGGWQLEEDQLTNMTTEELEAQGAMTGLVLERRTGTAPLEKIKANEMPRGIADLIGLGASTLKEVTVPDAMRGNAMAEESGVAVQSRQHASQQQLAVPLDNLARTRHELAQWIDYAITRYYDTERVFRITKTDPMTGREVEEVLQINVFDPDSGSYLNDMTAGEYDVVVSEQPMQVTFENSQYMQAIEMRREGIAIPDQIVVRHSNLADKHDVIEQMQASAGPPPDPLAEAKAALAHAQAKKTMNEAVNKAVEGMFSATQAAQNIAMTPAVAPLADHLLQSAGFEDANAPPIVPEMPQPAGAVLPPEQNTNPLTPANPAVGMLDGIEGGEVAQ